MFPLPTSCPPPASSTQEQAPARRHDENVPPCLCVSSFRLSLFAGSFPCRPAGKPTGSSCGREAHGWLPESSLASRQTRSDWRCIRISNQRWARSISTS